MSEQDHLTPEETALERALASLRPAAAQFQPTATWTGTARSRRRPSYWWPAAAAAVAIGLGTWFVAELRRSPPEGNPANNSAPPALATLAEPQTLLAYRRALARSTADLEAALDRHGPTRGSAIDAQTPVGFSGFHSAVLAASLGDM